MWIQPALTDALRANRLNMLVWSAFWVPLALCTAVAFSPGPTGVVTHFSGTLAHGAAFTYLTFALFRAHFPTAGRGDRDEARGIIAVTLWMFAFGVFIEVVQLFVAGRNGHLADLLPNSVGIAIGCGLRSGWTRGVHRSRIPSGKARQRGLQT